MVVFGYSQTIFEQNLSFLQIFEVYLLEEISVLGPSESECGFRSDVRLRSGARV